jgi:hypothetical protein
VAFAWALLLAAGTARGADPSVYLLLPSVTEGERELDLRTGVGSGDDSARAAKAAALGLGYGVTQRWFTEATVQYQQTAGSGTGLDSFEWENILQLAEPDEWPVDVGLALELERPRDRAEGPAARVGALLQKEYGRVQINLNLLLTRHFHGTEFPSTALGYQGQVKYRDRQSLEYGVQAFGNVGAVNRWGAYSTQTHRIGPVILGKFPLANERSIGYTLGVLLGTTERSPDRTLRLQVEFEF